MSTAYIECSTLAQDLRREADRLVNCASYFQIALTPISRKPIVEHAVAVLSARRHEFDAIAYRGNSGAVIAPILAYLLDVPLIVVRKTLAEEDSHASNAIEGLTRGARYVIVDDFVSSGNTVRIIVNAIGKADETAKAVGVYLYKRYPRDSKPDVEVWNTPDPEWLQTANRNLY